LPFYNSAPSTSWMEKKLYLATKNYFLLKPNRFFDSIYSILINSGVISDKVREIQMQNYLEKMELKRKRETELTEGLKLYKEGKYEAALENFESVLGSKPEQREAAVTSYNVACCYSQLNQIEAGLSALGDAMEAGYEDYQTIRTDPDIANLRSSEKFKPLLDKYDEPFINENAINAIKNLFGFNKK